MDREGLRRYMILSIMILKNEINDDLEKVSNIFL